MNPIDPRRSERHLLAALVRWARTNGWRSGGSGWENPARTFAIEPRDGQVVIWWLSTGRAPWPQSAMSSCRYILADSITQAIDLLVVYGYLPPMWSSAYALAEEKYREQAEALEADVERLRREDCDTCHDTGWAVEGQEFDGTPVRTPCTCGIGHDVRISLGWVEAISR